MVPASLHQRQTSSPGLGAWTAYSNCRSPWPPPWFISCDARQDSSANPPGEHVRDARLRRLEAILFLAREPLNSRKLSRYANLADGTEARTLIRRLNKFYEKSERAFRVEEIAGGFRLMTRPQFGAWVRRLAHVPPEVRLSAPALETLAVVAYRQPVLKATIEAVRGVNCGEVLRQLMERDLVRIIGRSDELGRPYLYAPTARFLEVFGLRSLDELPRVEGLRPQSAAALDNQHREEHDVTVTYPSAHPQQENETVRTPDLEERFAGRPRGAAGAVPVIAADDEFEEEELDEEEDEELEDDEDLDEEFDEELDEEEWEYEDEEDGEFEDDLEDDEWEEVEEDDEDLEDDDEDWEDDEDEEDEDWEDD